MADINNFRLKEVAVLSNWEKGLKILTNTTDNELHS